MLKSTLREDALRLLTTALIVAAGMMLMTWVEHRTGFIEKLIVIPEAPAVTVGEPEAPAPTTPAATPAVLSE